MSKCSIITFCCSGENIDWFLIIAASCEGLVGKWVSSAEGVDGAVWSSLLCLLLCTLLGVPMVKWNEGFDLLLR